MTRDWDVNTRKIETLDMVARLVDIFTRDIGSLQRVVAEVGKRPVYLFTGTPQNLAFVALEPPYPTRPGLYFINYKVEPNGRNMQVVRARARFQKGMLRFPGATPANRVPVISGKYRMAFSYGEKSGQRVVWAGSWPHNNRMPDLIRLKIWHPSSASLVFPPIIARVRADAELACLLKPSSGRPGHSGDCSAKANGELGRQNKERKNQREGGDREKG